MGSVLRRAVLFELRRLMLVRLEGPRVDSSLIADTPSTSASGQQLCQPLVMVETLGRASAASQDWGVGRAHVEHRDTPGVDLGQHGLGRDKLGRQLAGVAQAND